ncbi:ATP-binding protein [Solitalea sp. MAHUQ-68]|uniref:ATP-binding protein n=1 Tax=Solitalea agri TaxID=2953739 RepID=A0A9X2F2Z6_9SPHI|nr:ATP-binding protein [Solitalea agri]MCO4293239.1 ATP-binding protein [Solitalea agri]
MESEQIATVKRICIYGPESTGKSTLAAYLAYKFQTVYVPEIARDMISSNDFNLDDILKIGRAQTAAVLEKTSQANRFLFCDTDLITTQIYSDHYLGVIPEELYQLEKQVVYDAYFLTSIDVPWVPDGLRDLWYNREEMFEKFKKELEKRNITYYLVVGRDFRERQLFVVNKLRELFG